MWDFNTKAEGGTLRWLADYQSVLVNAFVDIESHGFPFDPIAHQTFIDKAERIYEEYEKKLRSSPEFKNHCSVEGVKTEDFNFSSPLQLSKLLFNKKREGGLGLKPVSRSKLTQKPSTDRDSLEHFAKEGVQFCADLMVIRNFAKLLSSFGEPLLKFYCEDTGAIHPSYFLAKVVDGTGKSSGTRSGRLSCAKPNLQQIPKRDKGGGETGLSGMDVRRSFVPSPGQLLVEIDQCVGVGTRVLTADLDWVPAEELQEGTEIVAFDETPSARKSKMRVATVDHVKLVKQPTYRVVTSKGTVICSADHRWLGCKKPVGGTGRKREWLTTRDIQVGNTIAYYVRPWELNRSWEGGWMAGFLDGYGWVSNPTGVGFGQNPGVVLDYALQVLDNHGVAWSSCSNKTGFKGAQSSVTKVRVKGEALQGLRVLGMFKPKRLMEKSRRLWENRSSWGKLSKPAEVLKVEYEGEQEVVALQTSTGTFIAEGFMSHNSQVEVRVAGMYAKDKQMGDFFNLGGDFHTRVASMVSGLDYGEMLEAIADIKHPKHEHTKKLRSSAKQITFGLMFGMGIPKLIRECGMTQDEGEKFIKTYFGVFPQFAKWRTDTIKKALRTGEAKTLFGRIRKLRIGSKKTEDKREERIGVNTPIQSAAADITLYGLARIWLELRERKCKTKIIGTIHDSIIFSVPPEELNEVLPWVVEYMVNPPGLEWLLEDSPVKLDVGVDIGKDFRVMREVPLDIVKQGKIKLGDYA